MYDITEFFDKYGTACIEKRCFSIHDYCLFKG